jgi:hypothetical protein
MQDLNVLPNHRGHLRFPAIMLLCLLALWKVRMKGCPIDSDVSHNIA